MTRAKAPAADAVRIVHVGLSAMPDTLVVVDAGRRTYLGLSRDGSYWHAIRPARPEDRDVLEERSELGALLCSCAAAGFGRSCYWTDLAAALEQGDRGFLVVRSAIDEPIPWLHDAALA